ncbi:MAG: NfeD family protein [Bacteroidia bacterium]|nr:NfeD family protein [Bacteroidia bacterium]
METWHIWAIIAIVLLIVEAFFPTFLALSIAIGCICSSIVSAFGLDFKIQLLAFTLGTLASFFLIRPFMLKYGHRNNVKTNAEALVGKIGRVTIEIDNSKNQGRAIVEGDDWKVESENNEVIGVDEKIEVVKVNSTILIVKSILKI